MRKCPLRKIGAAEGTGRTSRGRDVHCGDLLSPLFA
jgi:hypothetical protein